MVVAVVVVVDLVAGFLTTASNVLEDESLEEERFFEVGWVVDFGIRVPFGVASSISFSKSTSSYK